MAGLMHSPTARWCSPCPSAAAIRISRCCRRTGTRTRLRVPIIGQAQFVENGPSRLQLSRQPDGGEVRCSGAHDLRRAVALAKGIQTATGFGVLGRTGFSVSRTGTLVWLRAGADEGRSRLVRVDRDGKVSPLTTTVKGKAIFPLILRHVLR